MNWARIETGHYHVYAKPWGDNSSAKSLDIVKQPNAINPAAVWHLYISGNLSGMYYTLKAAKQGGEIKLGLKGARP